MARASLHVHHCGFPVSKMMFAAPAWQRAIQSVEARVEETGLRNGAHGAEKFGFKDLEAIHWNLPDAALVERAIAKSEGSLVYGGAFCAETGVHTGRSPKDKFVVTDAQTEKSVWWEKNGRLSQEHFQLLFDDFVAHAK